MSRGRLSLAFTLVAGFALAAGANGALAAGAVVQRPTSGGTYAFKTPEATPYIGARAVVHYVTTGPDAPALNDDNGDGYPDYVEQVAAAADVALAYYQQHGFKVPLADAAGRTRSPTSTSTPSRRARSASPSVSRPAGRQLRARLATPRPERAEGIRRPQPHRRSRALPRGAVLVCRQRPAAGLGRRRKRRRHVDARLSRDRGRRRDRLPRQVVEHAVPAALRRALQLRALLRRRVVVALPLRAQPQRAAAVLREARDRRPQRREDDGHRRVPARCGTPGQRCRQAVRRLRQVLARPGPPVAAGRAGVHAPGVDDNAGDERDRCLRPLDALRLDRGAAHSRGVVVAVPYGTARRRA